MPREPQDDLSLADLPIIDMEWAERNAAGFFRLIKESAAKRDAPAPARPLHVGFSVIDLERVERNADGFFQLVTRMIAEQAKSSPTL